MKKIITVALLVFAVIACRKKAEPPQSDVDLSKDLVAYYPFNGNTNDESGNKNHGSLLAGASLTYDLQGKEVSALDCNGNGGHLLVNNNGKIRFDSTFTISLDVMIRRLARHTFLSMVEYNTGFGPSFIVGTVDPKDKSLTFTVIDQNTPCDNFVTTAQSSGLNTGFEVKPEVWYNVICSFDKQILKTYVNGQLLTTSTSKDQVIRSCVQNQLLIGGWWKQDPEASLDGKIDNVRLYDRLLNSKEIEKLTRVL